MGNESLFQTKICAIVGARNSSLSAMNFASLISKNLAPHDITTISGLARGIDTAVHKASFPKTIAVIAGGIDHIYPQENKELQYKIASEGLLIAENAIGSKPVAASFPQRNRIIAAMSEVTIVVEASIRSGSLITARCALEYGREVGAVPGFPLDPRSEGANKLLKEGAHLIESHKDILELYRNDHKTYEMKESNMSDISSLNMELSEANHTKYTKQILSLLSSHPIDMDIIIEHTSLPMSIVHLILLELELAGNIVRITGNKFALRY
jgi:DNA processing protein